jgi:RNA polymerase sigma-70 factor (family 1)
MASTPKENLCDGLVFEKVYKAHSKALYRYLTYTYQDSVVSEDITQNVFLKLWEACHQFHMANIRSLIFTMGRNLCLNELKKNQKKADLSEAAFPFSPEADSDLEEAEFEQQLKAALAQLTENERSVFLMHRMDQLTYKEIAERLEISQKAVEKRMHHALKKLNKRLSYNLKRKK